MNTNLKLETVSRHLVCAVAALLAGGIALGVAAGPVEAKTPVAPAAKLPTHIVIVL